MVLSEQDREWVRAMIKEAASESLNEARDFARARDDAHVQSCPRFNRLKMVLVGIGIGAGVAGISGGTTVALQALKVIPALAH